MRQYQDWSVIQQHLTLLAEEGLVTTSQEDTLVIWITKAGIEAIKNMKKVNQIE
ncbi:MAG: hypothetical protein JSS94_07850 [Bacteroidetes bacterium]|nr:hypothetical protein [Bacteroidota bacterium]